MLLNNLLHPLILDNLCIRLQLLTSSALIPPILNLPIVIQCLISNFPDVLLECPNLRPVILHMRVGPVDGDPGLGDLAQKSIHQPQ